MVPPSIMRPPRVLVFGLLLLFVRASSASEIRSSRHVRSVPAHDCARSADEPTALRGMTAAHNRIRARAHGAVPRLAWSRELANVAQAHADELGERGCTMRHSRSPRGENLYWSFGLEPTPERVVGNWASELACYEPMAADRDVCTPIEGICSSCGHYTQIVSPTRRRLGCGMATCGPKQIWVCNYDPPGNRIVEARRRASAGPLGAPTRVRKEKALRRATVAALP